MVPKLLSSSHITSTKMEDELEESSDEEHTSSGDSNSESNGDNDFLEAINEKAGKKRKHEKNSEEEEEENETENTIVENTPTKKKKRKKKATAADLKPPTAEEMIRLRETENLFHSNLFRMQIEEMIKEVRPKKMERKQIKPWLESLKELFLNIEDSEELELRENVLPEGIKSPLPPLPKETKWSSHFKKPTSVSVVGSYSADCCLGPSLSVDVVVVIPKKCLLKEDYLNVRYHRKRAVYLGHLAAALRDSQLIDKKQGVRWTESIGRRLSPRLVVSPAGKLNTVKVFVSAVPQQDCFKLSRFTPDKNNIRESWITAGEKEDRRTPTPLYNTSVTKDLVMMSNESIRQQTLEYNNNLKDAVALLRVWLRQRNLDLGQGAFSGYLVSMLVVALYLSRRLNPLMSSYQIVRNVWLVLSQSDWTKEGFTMCSTKQEENAPSLEDFHRYFDVVFVDSTGYCNLAGDIHRLTYLRVRQEAQLAVQCLDNPDMNSFQALFMTPMPFLRQFDHVICINRNRSSITKVLDKEGTREERLNHFFSRDVLHTDIVLRVLQKGAGGRLEQLVYQLPTCQEWSVGIILPPNLQQRLIIGLRLNRETAFSIVEKGPPANEPLAAEFRALWGGRCELRRFRDGTVCEAVVWAEPTAPLASRRLITHQMVLSLLQERLGIEEYNVTYLADQLEPLLANKTFIPEGFEYGTGEEACNSVIQSYDRLAKQLRELPDLPLDVSSVQGVSPVFRGADVFPPLARTDKPQAKAGMQGPTCWLLIPKLGKAPDYISPVEVVMQLGLSRKWPEDLEAIRRIKAAFNIQVAKGLKEQFDLQTQAFPEYVDVFKDGFVFRIHIAYEREAVLLKESTLPDGKVCYRDTPESLELEKTTIHLPQLTGALHGVQQQWPSLSVACRLAKRWLSAQLLDSAHMPEVATELLIASLFLSPEPFQPLSQPQPMFLRFLHLLAHHNWVLEPVIINFNNDLKREDIVEIESHFRTERASLPPIFIATQYDRTSSVWTKDAPLLPVVVRLANLAKESLTILENNFLSSALLEECKIIFRPPLQLYDALIHLKPLQLPRLSYGIDFKFYDQPYQLKIPQERRKIPITGFDPAQCYLQELRENYGDYALFFHDTYGGKTIGVLFKPSVFEQYDFKVSHVNCRKPLKEGKKTVLTFNFDAVIEDFYNLGIGLVKTIDLSQKVSKKI